MYVLTCIPIYGGRGRDLSCDIADYRENGEYNPEKPGNIFAAQSKRIGRLIIVDLTVTPPHYLSSPQNWSSSFACVGLLASSKAYEAAIPVTRDRVGCQKLTLAPLTQQGRAGMLVLNPQFREVYTRISLSSTRFSPHACVARSNNDATVEILHDRKR